jgi:hypothetical protein
VAAHTPCANALDTMEATMGPINQYNILGRCFRPSSTELHSSGRHSASTTAAAGSTARVDYHLLRASRKLQQQEQEGSSQANQAVHRMQLASTVGEGRLRAAKQLRHAISCADRRYASVYYNSAEVRRALHAAKMEESGR